METPTESSLENVRVRYMVAAWLLILFYLPGADLIVAKVPSNAPWYWWDVAYVLYGQTLFSIAVVLTVIFPRRVPLSAVVGRKPTLQEVRSGLIFSLFLFFVAWAAAYMVFFPLSYLAPDFVTYWLIDLPPLIYFDFGSYPVLPNLLNLISLCVIAPVVEEFAFRGILLHRWAHKFGLRSAVLWSSLIFGIVHPDFLGAFAFGVGMCALYLRTQSLLLPIICHGVYNFAVWLLEVGYIVKDGPEYIYTLEQFQSDWSLGLIAGLIVITWVWFYVRKPASNATWKLPGS